MSPFSNYHVWVPFIFWLKSVSLNKTTHFTVATNVCMARTTRKNSQLHTMEKTQSQSELTCWVREGFCLFFLAHFNFILQLEFTHGFLHHQKIICWRSTCCKDSQHSSVTFTSIQRKMAYCYFDTFTSTKILPARVRDAGLLILEPALCFVSVEYYNAMFVSMAHLNQKIRKGKAKWRNIMQLRSCICTV